MRLHRFYISEPLSDSNRLVIRDEGHIHQWKKVFRYAPSDMVILFDGTGVDVTAEFEYIEAGEAGLNVIERNPSRALPSRRIHIYSALTKKDTFEWILQKATELGVVEVVPVIADRTEKKDINVERAQRILIEASEQCGRGVLPVLGEVLQLEDVVATTVIPSPVRIAFDASGTAFDSSAFESESDIYIYIGPEGGWTERELELFDKNGIKIMSLGELTLRAETAAVSGLTLCLYS